MDNDKAIAEINEVIAQVEAKLEPGCEIGARDKATIKGLLRLHNIDRNVIFFPCQRENSAKIIHHFVKIKGVPQSRFSINAQPGIFLLCGAEVSRETKPGPEIDVRKETKARDEVRPREAMPPKQVKAPKEVKPQKAAKEEKDAGAGKAKARKETKSKAKSQKPAKGKAGTKKAKGRGK